MKLKHNLTKFLLLFGVIMMTALIFPSCNASSGLADVTVFKISGALGALSNSTQVRFDLSIIPRHQLNGIFTVLLLSHDGYLYDSAVVSWSNEDFATPNPTERNIATIQEMELRSERLISLFAPSADKDIYALAQALSALYQEQAAKALSHGEYTVNVATGTVNLGSFEPNESDFTRISSKYVRIVVVDEKGLEKLLSH